MYVEPRKVRINAALLAQLPAPLASMVREWKTEYRKAFISVQEATSFYFGEDEDVTAFSADFTRAKRVDVAGEWSGMTGVMPSADVPLPPGCTVVKTGISCGMPWFKIQHNSGLKLSA